MASQELTFSSSANDYSGLCRICEGKVKNLRVLSCLHVFCEGCLKKMQENETFNNVIRCQVCGQETELSSKDVSRLPLDSLSCNRIDLKAIDIAKTICGSCRTGEVAVGHCTDCASFLCQNCYTAHQIMCYFKNHQVCSFKDMKENEECFTVTQNHITCKCHPDEILKYYCHTCHIPICCECIVLDHKQLEHCYAKTFDAEREERHKLKELIEECKSKVSFCEEAKTVLQSHLHELQEQHDCIKLHVESTCLSLKTILENQLQQSLREVEEIHSFQKTQLMETFNNAKKSIKKIEHACRFAEKVLNYGNNIEFLSLIHVVRKQLTYLIHNSSKPDISVGMIFETDKDKFETTIKEIFGHIKNAESPAKKKESPYSWEASSVNFSSSLDSDNSNFSTGNSSSNSLPQTDFDFKNNMVAQLNLIHLANLENRRTEENLSSFSSGTLPIPVSQNKLLINYIHPDVTPPQFDEINYSTALFNREPISLSNSLPAKENHSYRPKQRSSGIKPKTMHSRYKFGRKGSGKLEFNLPHGFCLGLKEEIIVADTNNHRIQVFEKHGNITYQFGIPGKKKGELWFPRKVAVIQSSESFVVCDRGSLGSRMQVFSKAGHFLKEINVRYVFIISGLVTTKEDTIIIVDSIKLKVFIISYYGDLLYSFDCSDYTKEPSDIAVYQNEFYICDFKGHCVAVFSDKGNFLRNFGIKGLTKYPTGIHITDEGEVLVADSHGNSYHIAIFSQQGVLIDVFECPYIKVNLCCGLKVTSEGFVITVAKHNHQVLVFDPLYILPNTSIKPSSVDVI